MGLLDLPPELLDPILRYLRDEFRGNLDLLSLSKTWFSAALPHFYHSTVLYAQDSRNWPEPTDLPPTNFDLIENLTLHLTPRELPPRKSEDWVRLVRELADEYMPRISHLLRSFTRLRILQCVHKGYMTYGAMDSLLSSIAEGPASTLNSLDLDLQSTYMPWHGNLDNSHGTFPVHICPEIGALLWRVPHVRLRLRRICSEIVPSLALLQSGYFVHPCRLESLVIDFVGDDGWWTSVPCWQHDDAAFEFPIDMYKDAARDLVLARVGPEKATFIITSQPSRRSPGARLEVCVRRDGGEEVLSSFHSPSVGGNDGQGQPSGFRVTYKSYAVNDCCGCSALSQLPLH